MNKKEEKKREVNKKEEKKREVNKEKRRNEKISKCDSTSTLKGMLRKETTSASVYLRRVWLIFSGWVLVRGPDTSFHYDEAGLVRLPKLHLFLFSSPSRTNG